MPVHANQTSWKTGKSANPNGRPPKGYSISDMMKEMLSKDPDTKRKICAKIVDKAIKGDVQAIKVIWQYMDGMPPQDITSGGIPLGTFTNDQARKIAQRITRRARIDGGTAGTK